MPGGVALSDYNNDGLLDRVGNYGTGVAIGDYDNDGYADLFVTSYGKNVLYHNNGDRTFTNVTAKVGVAGDGCHLSAGFFDYDNDGHLDLFVTSYMEWNTRRSKSCGGAWQTYLSARRISGHYQSFLSEPRRRHA